MKEPVVLFWTIIIMAFAGNLLIAFWVYADSKARGLKPKLCNWLFILTFLNSIWLVVYYIIFRASFGQNTNEVACSRCQTRISNDFRFCPECGGVNTQLEVNLTEKPKKFLLFAGITIIVLVLVVAVIFFG